MRIDRIEVTYEVVTPLFCGGAESVKAEVRLPSFKGVLRWWWRALAWSKFNGDLSEVTKAENLLFGSMHTGQIGSMHTRQSRVMMRLLPSVPPKLIKKYEKLMANGRVVDEGARYLGYGVMAAGKEEAGKLTRACIEAPFALKIEMRARDLDETKCTLLLDALKAMGTLGGMGAKSRKGYGSVVLRSMFLNGESESRWSAPETIDNLQNAIQELIGNAREMTDLAPYTALSSRTRIVLVPPTKANDRPLDLLNLIGREMVRFRSWGHRGEVLGEDSEKNFQSDHDLMKKEPDQRHEHPQRIIFGLPQNYGQRDKVGPAANGVDRRASPLLIHIHKCGQTPVAVLSLLPAQFLPKDNDVVNVGGAKVKLAQEEELWKPVNDFLDRICDSEKCKESLGKEVRP